MIDTRVLDHDARRRTTTLFHYDHATDDFYIEEKGEVGEVFALNKEVRKYDSGNWKGDMHHVAQIPPVIWADLWKRGIAQDQDRLTKWLNSAESEPCRLKAGRI